MKLDRIAASTTQRTSPESTERRASVASERVGPVEAAEGVAADRRRSLQEELAEIDMAAIGDFHGTEQVMQGARQVASRLLAMGTAAEGLFKPAGLKKGIRQVDDSA